jgi:hypothetical protein
MWKRLSGGGSGALPGVVGGKESRGMVSGNKEEITFRVIEGGLQRETVIGAVRVVAAPKGYPPFRPDGVVLEEDTFLVMSASPEVLEPNETMIRIMTRLMETKPEPPGSVRVKEGRPLRLMAIVHDFNEDPSWREEWVVRALRSAIRESGARSLRSLALPLLCTRHGRLKTERFARLLVETLRDTKAPGLDALWLMVPEGSARKVISYLNAAKGEETDDHP